MSFSPGWIFALSAVLFALSVGLFLFARPQSPRRSAASLLKLLQKVPFLADLSPDQLAPLAHTVREVRVPAGVYVLREHRVGETMFIVLYGSLNILKRGAIDETLVQTVGPGEVLGEMALLTGARRIASARTVTPCLLLQIERDDFEERLASRPEVHQAVWDACERHTIELTLADLESTRALPLAERQAWIASRTSVAVDVGAQLTTDQDRYLAVVAGALELHGRLVQAPALVAVRAGEVGSVRQKGRVCWLPCPQPGALLRAG